MVDRTVIQKILQSLNDSLDHLKSKQGITFAKYKNDKDLQAVIERRLETSIQACIDIGNHIVAQDNLGRPDTYGAIFTLLAEHHIISNELEKTLKKMAGFRNVLIHEYREIIVEKVYQVFNQHLNDFYAFAQAVMKYL